jgi:hypothetical protein
VSQSFGQNRFPDNFVSGALAVNLHPTAFLDIAPSSRGIAYVLALSRRLKYPAELLDAPTTLRFGGS